MLTSKLLFFVTIKKCLPTVSKCNCDEVLKQIQYVGVDGGQEKSQNGTQKSQKIKRATGCTD
jgi:hypothetical protein